MNKRQVVLGAALAGILAASANIAPAQADDHGGDKAAGEAHKCKGQNSCKGKKKAEKAGENKCKGANSCKAEEKK